MAMWNQDIAGLRDQIMGNVEVIFPILREDRSAAGITFKIVTFYDNDCKVDEDSAWTARVLWGRVGTGACRTPFIEGKAAAGAYEALDNLLDTSSELLQTLKKQGRIFEPVWAGIAEQSMSGGRYVAQPFDEFEK